MARKAPGPLTPCDNGWSSAYQHGTARACRIWGCRCVQAWEAEKQRKREWNVSPAGRAYWTRVAARRRAERRGPDGLTNCQRFIREARDCALGLVRAGYSHRSAAHAVGVVERTVNRWVAAAREEAR